MSEAESIVFFTPICHVGCLSASSTRALRISSAGVFQNGPPEAVRTMLAIRSGGSPSTHWKDRAVFAVDRKQPRAAGARVREQQLARGNHKFFVGHRNVDAGVYRGKHRIESDRAVRCREQNVGLRIDRHRAQSRRAVGD